jgi:D-glycero-D-manno-heptose 1,7-bisphosphate phosphatase
MVGLAQGAAVFLDRDGTLIRDVGYLQRAAQIEILPKVAPALCQLRNHGFRLVVVTNQSAVGRGWMTERDLAQVHASLVAQLAEHGARLDAIYYCPHHPVEGVGRYRTSCRCRKPDVGMIERAAAELGVNPAASYVIGDQKRDMELAERVGATALLIGADEKLVEAGGAIPVADLWEAAQWIVNRSERAAKPQGDPIR